MQHMALLNLLAAQVWADKLAAADDADGTCAVIQELFQAEDIPYGVATLIPLAFNVCLKI